MALSTGAVCQEPLSGVCQLHVDVSASSREAHTARYRCTSRAKKGMSIFSTPPFDVLPHYLLSMLPSFSPSYPPFLEPKLHR